MKNKIKSIKEKVLQSTTLPDGYYNGIWSGYLIEIQYKEKTFYLATEEGVRGIGVEVIVQIENEVPTFDIFNK